MAQITDVLNSIYQMAESAIAGLVSSTHFLFAVVDQPKNTFKVIHWQGNEAISSSYSYTLSLATSGVR